MENIFFDLNKLKYLGKDCIIGKSVRIRNPERCIIGDGTIIDDFTYISSTLITGKHCHIASNITISGGSGVLTLGDYVGISAGSTVFCASSDYNKVCLDMPSVPKNQMFGGETRNIKIGSFVLLGAQSCVLPGAIIPDGFSCGAYSLIQPDVKYEPWSIYVGGTKLKLLRQRDTVEIQQTEVYKNYYNNWLQQLEYDYAEELSQYTPPPIEYGQ